MLWWSDDLKTGIKTVDEQHKSIFDVVGQLLCNEDNEEEIEGVLDFLQQYVATHFYDEEKAMMESKYPNYSEHKEQHNDFKSKLTSYMDNIESEGVNEENIDELKLMVIEWLVVHINGSDKQFAEFYLSRKAN